MNVTPNEPELGRAFLTLLRRDLLLAFRRPAEIANPLLFFIIVVTLFPLGIGPEPNTLQTIAPGVIWVAALLASMLSLDGMFRTDFDDGALEQILLSPHPLSVLVLAKVIAHWMVSGLPLILLSPLLGMFMNLTSQSIVALVLTLLLGTPVLSLIGSIGTALTVGLRKGGVLLSLLVLPLYIPVLIFAASAVEVAGVGFPIAAQLSFLGALLALALTLAPLATAASLRISVS
ncbi:MAG: heme exporter protein CcmB [Gammaproteobacteria bacterium]|nr:heme exporter protein CcmB [Gammaproteobacteria bacterium]MCP5135639.1 heme exporter protein CcmB [Gammaproteobacteria bacterium]